VLVAAVLVVMLHFVFAVVSWMLVGDALIMAS
jgi:hypothetical protein